MHLQKELTHIGVLVTLFLEETIAKAGEESQNFTGLFISETEVNSIIQTVCCISGSCEEQELKSEEIEVLERTISTKN